MVLRLKKRRAYQRGASLIAFTLLLTFVILPMVGLGIDVAIQYWIKAKLSSAVDSAALAAGRSLNVGSTVDPAAVGRQYFAANFPAGILRTTVINGQQVANSVSISVAPVNGYITVSAKAQVNAPLYFLKMLHLASGIITATSQTTRRNANIVLVLDRSGSMANANNSCGALISAVNVFTSQFIDGRDELGLITFSTTSHVDYQPNLHFQTDSQTLDSVINTMACVGATSTAQALTQAYSLIKATNVTSALNVILFFTDGGANSVVEQYPGYFPIKTKWDYRYGTYLTSQTDHVAPSSCSASDVLYGGYTDLSESLNTTGSTAGVSAVGTDVPLTAGAAYPPPISPPGSLFSSTSSNACGWGTYTIPCARNDVAYIPPTDAWGNSTLGYKPAYTYTSGPYINQIRSDSPLAIRNAAINAADAISQQIRSNTTYNIVTYTIGLAGNEPIPMDTDFLERLANDTRASNYNPSQPQGMFVLAANNASLLDAFNAVASQILRLSK